MIAEKSLEISRMHRIWLFPLFFLSGLIVFLPEAFSTEIPNEIEIPMRLGFSALFLVIALGLQTSSHLNRYRLVFFALFTASIAQFIDWHYSQWMARALNIDPNSPEGYAIDKLESTLLLVLTILILHKASGGDMASLYLKRGKVRQWVFIGGGAFIFFVVTSIWTSEALFQGRDLRLERILPWAPWVILFTLSNGLNEELLFRGLFLKKLDPILGAFLSNLLITLIFVIWHTAADYSADLWVFLGILFILSFIWGWIVQKTDSIWGAVLFHAGADIPVILGILSTT
jgi:membrane protease YdiL (CAAX protease family)